MKKFTLALLFVCSSTLAIAQKISGGVIDKEGQGIEYVNIGILNGTIGTISDNKGEFKITLPDSLNHNILRFSRLGFEPYETTVKEFKSLSSRSVVLDRDIVKIGDVRVQSGESKRARFKEVVINQRGVRVLRTLSLQESPKITVNWVSDPKIGYQYGVVVESDKQYMPQRMEIPVLNCLTDTVMFRVNIYDIDSNGNISKTLNTDEIFFTVKKKDAQKNYNVDISSQGLVLKGKQYFAIEVIVYSYLLDKDEMIIKFPLYSTPSYFRKSSQGAFERFNDNLGIKVWALVKK